MSNGAGKAVSRPKIPGGIVSPDGTVDHKSRKNVVLTDTDRSQILAGTKLQQEKGGLPTTGTDAAALNNSPAAIQQRKNRPKNKQI